MYDANGREITHLLVNVIQDAGKEFCLDGQYIRSVSLVHPISDEFLER